MLWVRTWLNGYVVTCVCSVLDLRNGLEDFLYIGGHNWVSTGDNARGFEILKNSKLADLWTIFVQNRTLYGYIMVMLSGAQQQMDAQRKQAAASIQLWNGRLETHQQQMPQSLPLLVTLLLRSCVH